MKKTSQVDQFADQIKISKKSSVLNSFFKKMFYKNMKSISYGYLTVIDRSDTTSFGDPNHKLSAKIEILSPEFYVLLGSGGDLGAAESYIAGYWKSQNLVELLQIVIKNQSLLKQLDSGLVKLFKPINYFIHRRRQNTLLGSKKNILAHYDLSNDFYKLWLDPTMTYSSAIFEPKGITLKEASIEKLDRICRKLNLNNKDKILEIGSGWGSFAIHAAKKYGCHITTTTISDAQYEHVQLLIKKEGLQDRIKLLNKDYRKLNGQFDKLVSIEMIEAVGNNFMNNYFNTISKLVKSNGLICIQGITYNDQGFKLYKNNVDFIKKYIFPGSCLISIENIMTIIKNNTDLALVHLEDITIHYAETLFQWRKAFYNSKNEIRNLGFSNAFINMWEYYFVYCEAGFLERKIGDVQMVFAKSNSRNVKIKF